MSEHKVPVPANTLRNQDGTPYSANHEEIRGGIIHVSDRLMAELNITNESAAKGILTGAGLFAMIKEKFLLPEHYTIREVFSYPIRSTRDLHSWAIFVESSDLPVITERAWPPSVKPIYTRSADGQVRLVEIKIEDAIMV